MLRIFSYFSLHRLTKNKRMGFNNHGIDAMIRNIENSRFKGILGINNACFWLQEAIQHGHEQQDVLKEGSPALG